MVVFTFNMTHYQYTKWAAEIKAQKDQIISLQQYVRLCQCFIQDIWLDAKPGSEIKHKANVMFDLQGHFVK